MGRQYHGVQRHPYAARACRLYGREFRNNKDEGYCVAVFTRRLIITIKHSVEVRRRSSQNHFMRVDDFSPASQRHIAQLGINSHPIDGGEGGDAMAGILMMCLRQKLITVGRRRA